MEDDSLVGCPSVGVVGNGFGVYGYLIADGTSAVGRPVWSVETMQRFLPN